jgi:hypothetical protein
VLCNEKQNQKALLSHVTLNLVGLNFEKQKPESTQSTPRIRTEIEIRNVVELVLDVEKG